MKRFNKSMLHKKFLIILIGVVGVMILTSITDGSESTGAPPVSSGAPDEKDCTTSGCHDDGTVNTGPGMISLLTANQELSYEAGKTYTFTAKIEQQGIKRFGYQVLAIDENGNNAGQFIVTDSSRTQVFPGYGDFTERRYITYTYAGTDPFLSNTGQWVFDWKATSTTIGKVKFYLAALAGNNDGTDDGDEVYTTSIELTPSAVGLKSYQQDLSFNVYPNPVVERVNIHYTGSSLENVQLNLLDLSGKTVLSKSISNLPGNTSLQVELDDTIKSGVYFLKLSDQKTVTIKRVVIQ